MALGSTRPLREMSTRNLPVGKGRRACKAGSFIADCKKCGGPRLLATLWDSNACYRDGFIALPLTSLSWLRKRFSTEVDHFGGRRPFHVTAANSLHNGAVYCVKHLDKIP
jgi:hypothetical protein